MRKYKRLILGVICNCPTDCFRAEVKPSWSLYLLSWYCGKSLRSSLSQCPCVQKYTSAVSFSSMFSGCFAPVCKHVPFPVSFSGCLAKRPVMIAQAQIAFSLYEQYLNIHLCTFSFLRSCLVRKRLSRGSVCRRLHY